MRLNRVGFVGWRGMVGSVLLQRMMAENDFSLIDQPLFFTTSQAGRPGPEIGREVPVLVDAYNLDALAEMDVIVTTQGGDYSGAVQPQLRSLGWNGYWIDAASTFRMADDATIVLDPVNLAVIERGLAGGQKNFIGGNCTVSLMMMALDGLLNADLVEWVTVMTYQAVSGGGARQMRELLEQMGSVHQAAEELLADPVSSILQIDKSVIDTLRSEQLPVAEIGLPLAGSLLPWIDREVEPGMSREEWKGSAETNKILGREADPIPVQSICIRVGTLRCHSQAFTIKLKKELPEDEIGEILEHGNDWVSLVPNERGQSLSRLTPAAVSGTLDIPIGRVRKFLNGGRGNGGAGNGGAGNSGRGNGGVVSAFTVGDQLLWGAAEPLRRMLRILEQH